MASSPNTPKWKHISQRKKEEQWSRVPQEWRLKSLPGPEATNLLDVPRTCGLLTTEELKITEDFDATALGEAIRNRRFKCVDVARAFCKRAAIAHQLTNCLTEIFFSDALARAAELDAHLDSGKPPLSALHGVPVSLKDTFKVKGYDASIGIAALCFNPVTQNSVLVDALLDAGAVLYCKTNVPQTLMALDSHNNVFGRTLNPLNTRLTAGGSSGGEGALLAMKGSVLGVGTDVGGSIRIPAMCNGLYGVKGSWQRVPYAGQEGGMAEDAAKLGIPASAGPLGRSVRDLDLFFNVVANQRPWEKDPDVIPSPWDTLETLPLNRKLRIGIVRRDGIAESHPPINTLLTEVKTALQKHDVDVVELDLVSLLSQAQSLANALFNIFGGNYMFDLLESTSEPLSPWLAGRLKRKPEATLEKVRELQAKRTELQCKFLSVWRDGEIDALICPVAPHPVPEIDRWNTVSFTSAFVLMDLPAGVVPVRRFGEADLEGDVKGEVLGGWDQRNRELWDQKKTDRGVYLGSSLSVQVVCEKLRERKLVRVMGVVDEAVRRVGERGKGARL